MRTHWREMALHAGTRYKRLLRRAGSSARRLEAEPHHLHEIEQQGEAGATPFIAIGGLILFLLPIFLLMLGLALTAYYLSA